MKILSLLIAYLVFINTAMAGLPPTTASGQADAAKTTTFNFKVPNSQSTKVSGATLLETGNANILIDPSLEGANNSSAWVFTGGVLTIDNTPIHGLINGQIDTTATSLSMTQSSTLYQAQFADGVQGLASMRVRVPSSITTPIYVCSIQNGVEGSISSGCVQVQANGKWGLYKVPFILGATSNGIALTSKGVSYTGAIEWDDGFVGAVDLKQDVDQSRIAGESYFAGTANCGGWARTSTTIGAVSTDADCPGPTIVNSSMGTWATTDSNLPIQTITNLPAGRYKATFTVAMAPGSGAYTVLAINDGTTTCEAIEVNNTAAAFNEGTISCSFNYTSAGDRSFQVYTASEAGSVTIINQRTTPRASVKFILEYFGSGSVYSTTNADTDWASCGHTTSSFTGFGTVTNIETQCKRQGGDLLMKGKFTSGTSTAVEARLSLPTWNGVALTSKGVSVIPTLQIAGAAGQSIPIQGNLHMLIEPSTAYLTFGYEASASYAALSKAIATIFIASGTTQSFNARIPINGWENSNIIIGSFNGLESCSSTLECTDTFSATVSAAGVVSNENIDWINGNAAVSGTSIYDITLKTGLAGSAVNLSQPLNCTATPQSGSAVVVRESAAPTTSTLQFTTFASSTTSASAQIFKIVCQKGSSDYIGKTAKAVASDQNIATPGLTKVKACYYAFGGASATLASPTECTSGTCVEVIDSCGTGTPPTRSGSAGVYNDLTFASGTFANNTFVRCDCTSYDVTTSEIRQCTPYFVTADQTISSTASGSYVANIYSDNASGVNSDSYSIVTCEGQAP